MALVTEFPHLASKSNTKNTTTTTIYFPLSCFSTIFRCHIRDSKRTFHAGKGGRAHQYKNPDSRTVVPKLVRTVTQVKVAILSYYPQNFFAFFRSKISSAVITHNTEKQCGLVLCYPRRIAYYPWGLIYPQFGNHCSRGLGNKYVGRAAVIFLKVTPKYSSKTTS